MEMHKIFGTKESADYSDREGAYLIPFRNSLVGVVQTPKGYFFLGGGLEPGESHVSCIHRECLEEAGCLPTVQGRLCSAESFLNHPTIGYFHPIQTYYYGELGQQVFTPTESDHLLRWIPYTQLRGTMYLEMQNWALEQLASFIGNRTTFADLADYLKHGREIEFSYNSTNYSITNHSGFWYLCDDTRHILLDTLCRFEEKDVLVAKTAASILDGITIERIFDEQRYDADRLYII